MSSDGTPLEALETGEVSNVADASRMAAILRDMNSSGAETQAPPPPQVQPQAPPPPQYTRMAPPPVQPPQYVEEPQYEPVPKYARKKNVWTSILEGIRDPLFVAVLFFVLSLPAIHTLAGKYATWAFAVGGQLSWLGLLTLSVLSGLLFSLYRATGNMLGMY